MKKIGTIIDRYRSQEILKKNKMNKTTNYLENNFNLEDKTIQTSNSISKKNNKDNKDSKEINSLINKNNLLKFNTFNKNFFTSRNKDNLLPFSERIKNFNLFQKTKTSSENLYNNEAKYKLKENSVNKNNCQPMEKYYQHKTISDFKKLPIIDIDENNDKNNKYKNQCINIFTLLSLKKGKINKKFK